MAVGTQPSHIAPAAVSVAAPRVGLRRRFDAEYWANIRFLVFGRAVPGMLFGFMGWLQLQRVVGAVTVAQAGVNASSVARVIAPALYTLFCGIPAALYLTRPRPRARDGRLIARCAAFTGTLMQLVVGAFLGAGTTLLTLPAVFDTVSVALGIVALSGALWSLAYLRRSLSIIPEARRLTTGGPYRLVRHPMYFFEILAAVAVLGSVLHAISVISLCVFVAMQVTRSRFEERLLAGAFAEYTAYARRTRRLVPFVW
jgi:protein-S-isoprenylcysteine O-methyltransferase Ste14